MNCDVPEYCGGISVVFNYCNMSRDTRKPVFGVSDQVLYSHRSMLLRSLKFRIQVEEKLFYPCSKNKGADRLVTALQLLRS